MTAIARPFRDRRRSAGPVAIALLLAVAGFVLALSVGAALQSGPDAAPSSSENAAVGGSPAPASVREVSATEVTQTTAAKLSAVPALPALHGVKARKKAPARTAKPRTATPRVSTPVTAVTPAPTAAPQRVVPVAPRTSTPKAPAKKTPGFVGKDFDSSG